MLTGVCNHFLIQPLEPIQQPVFGALPADSGPPGGLSPGAPPPSSAPPATSAAAPVAAAPTELPAELQPVRETFNHVISQCRQVDNRGQRGRKLRDAEAKLAVFYQAVVDGRVSGAFDCEKEELS